jgi:hypothetical protein
MRHAVLSWGTVLLLSVGILLNVFKLFRAKQVSSEGR